jgi:hypothetical protein
LPGALLRFHRRCDDRHHTRIPAVATPHRVFFGWWSPLLPAAAEWLLERAGTGGAVPAERAPDLQRTVAVLPGRRGAVRWMLLFGGGHALITRRPG